MGSFVLPEWKAQSKFKDIQVLHMYIRRQGRYSIHDYINNTIVLMKKSEQMVLLTLCKSN